jgi:hypothetical protein
MLNYTDLKRDRKKLLALTGLTPKEFKLLLPAFKQTYERMYPLNKTLVGKPRHRLPGGGRKGALTSVEQKLLFALVYQKTYPLQALLGCVFELSQPRVNYWVHHLLPVLQCALNALGTVPERDPRQFADSKKQRQQPPDFIIDGTERRRQRPKSPAKQVLHYSGKKKAHSDKNVVIVQTRTKRVAYLSQTYGGKTHDKKIADVEEVCYPRAATLHKDTGFQGYEPPVRKTYQPKKSRAVES